MPVCRASAPSGGGAIVIGSPGVGPLSALLALVSSLLWGTSDFLGGTASRRIPVSGVLGTAQLVALLGLVPLALVTGELHHDRGYLLPAVAAGLVGLVALAAFFRALSVGTMGVVAPIAALGVVIPVGVGLVQGESPTAVQLLGLVVAIVGVVLASGPELSGGAGRAPLLLAAVAAAGFGTVIALVAAGSRGPGGSVLMTLLTMRLTAVLVLTALLVARALRAGGKAQRWEIGVRRTDVPLLAAIGIGDVAANATFAVASQTGLVSVTAALASLYPVVTALLAYRFHAERLRPVQLVGVAAAILGAGLLAAG